MEKKTFNLCIEVLRRLQKAKVLDSIILIGSWSIYFYQYYFKSAEYVSFIRTRDVDFLIPRPFKFRGKVDVSELIEDLGFVEQFSRSKGYMRLVHPDLTVEFLVPERGRGSDKPYPGPQLSTNAQPLRFLDFLAQNTISIEAEKLRLQVPHPAAYTLHKFIIFRRRSKRDKHERDLEGAIRVFRQLMKLKKQKEIKKIYGKMHKRWQCKVLENLKFVGELEIVDILSS